MKFVYYGQNMNSTYEYIDISSIKILKKKFAPICFGLGLLPLKKGPTLASVRKLLYEFQMDSKSNIKGVQNQDIWCSASSQLLDYNVIICCQVMRLE